MNLISRVKSFIIHYRTRCSCVSRLRTREMFMHSPRNPTPSPTYELSFPLGGDLLKLFMFDMRFFTRDASLSLYMYIYIFPLIECLENYRRIITCKSPLFPYFPTILSLRFSCHSSTFFPSPFEERNLGHVDDFSGERDEGLFVDLIARARFGRNVFTGV